MKIDKLNEVTGRPVIIKKISVPAEVVVSSPEPEKEKDVFESQSIELDDLKHPRIYALIPAFEINGKFISMETGKIVEVKKKDQIMPVLIGTALFFQDGTRVVYTRGWYKGFYKFFFAENKCAETTTAPNIHVFGEDSSDPAEQEEKACH